MANGEKRPCHTVGDGGVGESGASSQLIHQVTDTGTGQQLMVLKRTKSSLCPNTGAVALLTVNGTVQAAGTITGEGDSIQVTADVGAWVTAIVHTVPLFNDVVCIRLGELEFELEQCVLVG